MLRIVFLLELGKKQFKTVACHGGHCTQLSVGFSKLISVIMNHGNGKLLLTVLASKPKDCSKTSHRETVFTKGEEKQERETMKIVKFLKQRKYLSKSGYLLFSVISSSPEHTFSSSTRNSLSH